jgi:hypothetical protein
MYSVFLQTDRQTDRQTYKQSDIQTDTINAKDVLQNKLFFILHLISTEYNLMYSVFLQTERYCL